jgi:hypothetical protein
MMKKSDKVILWVTLSVAGLMLGSALLWAGWNNLGNYFAAKERKEREQTAEYQRLADEKRAQMRAFWETPEGKARAAEIQQEAAKRNQAAAATQAKANQAVWARWVATRDAVCRDGITVRPTSDSTEMFVIMPSHHVAGMSNYELKNLAQTIYKALGGDNCRVYIHDEAGVEVAKAWMWGASSSK